MSLGLAPETMAAMGTTEKSWTSDSNGSLPSQGGEIPYLGQERPEHIKLLGQGRGQR